MSKDKKELIYLLIAFLLAMSGGLLAWLVGAPNVVVLPFYVVGGFFLGKAVVV